LRTRQIVKNARVVFAIVPLLISVSAATAQQLPSVGAWDGLGMNPYAERVPKRHSARQQNSHTPTKSNDDLTTGSLSSTPVDTSSSSWSLERSADEDPENQKLKRATQICKGC
jgi:hypothetical protein